MYEDGSRDECLLKGVESIITEEIEHPGKTYQWNNNV